jgi:hypothetical protein
MNRIVLSVWPSETLKEHFDVREAYEEIATKIDEELREVRAVRWKEMGKKFDPEKYGMIFCLGCHGSGRSFNNPEGGHVCEVCGGFGLIKRENDLPDKTESPDQISVLRL